MTSLVRVSGTRVVNPQGNTGINNPGGIILLNASSGTQVTQSLTVTSTGTATSGALTVVGSENLSGNLDVGGVSRFQGRIIDNNASNVGNIINNPTGTALNAGDIDQTVFSTTAERKLASAYFAGGVGIEQDLAVGGFIYGRIAKANTSTSILVTATNSNTTFYPLFTDYAGIVAYGQGQGATLFVDDSSTFNDGGLTYNAATGVLSSDRGYIAATDNAVSTTTGAFTVTGGVGIGQDIYIGGNVLPGDTAVSSIGSSTVVWPTAFLDNIYTKLLGNATDDIKMSPNNGISNPDTGTGGTVDIYGEIRVRGSNPIGTAPVVTNVLYVTMDGNDTNDGRAQDASRACRTIGAAMRSPYYQPGTQILVSPGHYLEDNPLLMKPYTSVRGSDIRTTSIEPINKTQDLFHMNSGCYLNYMQFLNGRSGLLEGTYDARFNRGAYCTAFPPLVGDERIDLFHSPYVQNCTNLTGPWLRDGTMFTPDQTVQVPLAVGTGTWAANTTTIVVNVSTGTIKLGQAINPGQQNPGFFNARTLLLANKPFLQEQVITYITQQITTATNSASIWYEFNYNQEICRRDVGILVENVAYDAAFGGNEKSVESGLAYWNGVVSIIAAEKPQTVAAIDYLNSLTQQVVVNNTATDLLMGMGEYPQVINWVLTGGAVSTSSITSLFNTITNIIANGPSVAPAVYRSTGPDAAFVSAEILMQANRKFIQESTINYINYNLVQPQPVNYLPYNKVKCKRDTGIVIDSIAADLLYPTAGNSQTTFAGLQYYYQDQYVGAIATEITTTTAAIAYLKDIAVKVIQNVTAADDTIVGITRFGNNQNLQDTSVQPATSSEIGSVKTEFAIILDILGGDITGWTDLIVANGPASNLPSVQNTYQILINNIPYFQNEVIGYITSPDGLDFNSFDTGTCERDIGYMISSVAFDLLHGGNRQAIQSGLSYYSVGTPNTVIPNETTATVAAFNFLRDTIETLIVGGAYTPLQMKVAAVTDLPVATGAEQTSVTHIVSTLTNIIATGPAGYSATPINTAASGNSNVVHAYNIIKVNRAFLVAETLAYIDQTYNASAFSYDQDLCYRDTGLLVDAVSQDILLGGNQKSIEAALSYWNQGYSYVSEQVNTTTAAINYIRDISLQIIANQAVTPVTGTYATQVINPYFQYGGDYMPQQAVSRNFDIITTIISQGPLYAPPVYAGGGLFALTGINGADVRPTTRVTAVSTITAGKYLVGLSTATVGFGNNATLYFGDTGVFPKQDYEVEALSLEYTGNASTWNQRKVDPVGGMGGSLVDGNVISDRSPIQSFVYDAFTQLTQGGRGIHITNNGYAQLVSVFTIFSSVGVQTDNGGIASIVNSNANFGDICLLAKGYGTRRFSGTVYNPVYRAYTPSNTPPNSPGIDGFDQYYPNGFWPNNGEVQIFVPDLADRPHISLVMEVEPPPDYINEQAFPGFLNAQPSLATLTTGTITITGINTEGVAVGNSVYIRDQFGYTTSTNTDVHGDFIPYTATGTVVTDIGYESITLNYALPSGGGDVNNANYFTLYFCGNAYYTVLSSTVAENPRTPNVNILSTAGLSYTDIYGNSISPPDQVSAHVDALRYLNTLTDYVVSNSIYPTPVSLVPQPDIQPLVSTGAYAIPFIDNSFSIMKRIVGATDINTATNVVPSGLISKTGTIAPGAGDAVTLIKSNIDWLATEVSAYVAATYTSIVDDVEFGTNTFNAAKCERDVKLILRRLIYDLETGGNYNTVYNGLSYWSRNGTHHIVSLGEAVRRTDLFPDGANVNFYQRSYISASGYVFEYVGAGTNYGALPQVGLADPVQTKETVQLDSGKVFFTSTDQNGDFRIGPGLVISQATGVLSGRTFTKSLFANMTPFILAIEGI